ncbi:unnamed protein product [Mytilus coruscus]|uniref:Uncharacterized protein n=1 Tax=Mytilus coruscus TaxID=42192 RepID=A0A6J8BEN5_MYTCO|nr:unnamed protein product [Mytilus coruscus]
MHYYNKQNNKCERIYRNNKNVFYQVYYKITVEQEKVDQIKLKCSIECMLYDYFRVEDGICSYFKRILSDVQCCYLSDWYHPQEIKNVTHHEYMIGVNFLVTVFHDQTMYVEAMSSSFVEIFEDKSIALEPISRKELDLVPDFTKFDYFDNGLYYDTDYYNTHDDQCFADYKTITIVSNFFCPRIKLNSNEVQLSNSYLTILNTKKDYEINGVLQIENDFLVCLDDNTTYNSGSGKTKSQTQKTKIEKILSLICSIISITSLALTMIV